MGGKGHKLYITPQILKTLYWDEGKTAVEIARIYGVSPQTIWMKMKSFGIQAKLQTPLKLVTRDEFFQLYHVQGLTTYQIAKKFSVDPSSVWGRLHTLKIPLRKTGGCKRGTRGLGKHRTAQGYVRCLMPVNSPYTAMARTGGYVLEHRLVMAKHVGRCLLPKEVVHHKNSVKDDNRLENLELLPSWGQHTLTTMNCQNCTLKKEIRLLRWELKQLRESLQTKLNLENNL